MKCKICAADTKPHDRGLMLGRYQVQFFRCPSCGFVQTEEPFWLKESYSSAINRSDIGYVGRNLAHAKMVHSLIGIAFDPKARFIDFGGGYGMFVRLMRDLGFDFYWRDKYCDNLFAGEHVAPDILSDRYELLTAFEVFEHLTDPMSDIHQMAALSDTIVFSTGLTPDVAPPVKEWVYYGLDHGQHVAFYTRAALLHIAGQYGMRLFSHGGFLHMLTRRNVSSIQWWAALNRYTKFLFTLLYRRPTLLWRDTEQVAEAIRASRQ